MLEMLWRVQIGFGVPSRALERNSRKSSESVSGTFLEIFRNFLWSPGRTGAMAYCCNEGFIILMLCVVWLIYFVISLGVAAGAPILVLVGFACNEGFWKRDNMEHLRGTR